MQFSKTWNLQILGMFGQDSDINLNFLREPVLVGYLLLVSHFSCGPIIHKIHKTKEKTVVESEDV